MKKGKLLASLICSVVLSLSLIVGATFALFTSSSKVDITVSSGDVSISASVDETSINVDATYEGSASAIDSDGDGIKNAIQIQNLIPGDSVSFKLNVKNVGTITAKYRAIIACESDDGLFEALVVTIGNVENKNFDKYVTNWKAIEADDSVKHEVDIKIALPMTSADQNQYKNKSCTIAYGVEAVQGNAETTNESTPVDIAGTATESATLQTNGADSPVVELPAAVLNAIPDTAGSVSLQHSEPIVDKANKTITFDTMEIVDQAGNEIDLETLGNTTAIEVTLPAQEEFAAGTQVYIYHDGEYVATATVNADKTISYTATHFCEVQVSTKVLSDSITVYSYNELTSVLAKAKAAKKEAFTIVLGDDIAFTKQLEIGQGLALTLDLNGYDIEANISQNELIQLKNTDGNSLTIMSSDKWARIQLNGKALVLAYADVTISDVEVVVGEIKSSSYTTVKMQKGDLIVKDAEFNVSWLGTSLINGASSVTIEDTALYLNTFKTNAGAVISNNAATKVALKNVKGTLTLDPTYGQYFVMRDADNVTMENCDITVKDTAGVYYEVVRIENESVNDRIGFKKVPVTDINNALKEGKDVTLDNTYNSITINADDSNAYGATGLNIFGGTLDLNGNTLKVNTSGTWGSAINITSGTIKNGTIAKGFRGIFINHNSTVAGKVTLENVIIDGPTYTISCDQGTNSGFEAIGCTFNGWTSFAATLGEAKFTNCNFGAGAGNNFSCPYAPTTYVNCNFAADHKIDPRAAVTFENCTIGGVALTAENLATLVTSNIQNATVIG